MQLVQLKMRTPFAVANHGVVSITYVILITQKIATKSALNKSLARGNE